MIENSKCANISFRHANHQHYRKPRYTNSVPECFWVCCAMNTYTWIGQSLGIMGIQARYFKTRNIEKMRLKWCNFENRNLRIRNFPVDTRRALGASQTLKRHLPTVFVLCARALCRGEARNRKPQHLFVRGCSLKSGTISLIPCHERYYFLRRGVGIRIRYDD